MRRMIVAVIVGTLATLLLGVAGPAQAARVTLNDYEQLTLRLINQERAKRSLPLLSLNAKLTAAARAHSADMGERQYFAHTSPSGRTFRERIVKSSYTLDGYRAWRLGENLAWGAGLSAYPSEMVRRWMASARHRKVLLTRAFRAVGIGAVLWQDGYGDVENPVWFYTLDLGRRYR